MESQRLPTLLPNTLHGLADHLRLTCSNLSVEQAATLAISEWQATHGKQLASECPNELRGYQWKTLFLPQSTQLRMIYGGNSHYAQVHGDHIWYQGHKVSPRAFAMMITHSVRNAWRELWIRFPESRDWKSAHACRVEHEKNGIQSPVETMTSAAAAMSQALKVAQMLVEQTSTKTIEQVERRLASTRRGADRMHDDCSFD